MTAPSEESVLRWAATFAFLGFFTAALYMVGATWAPWIGAVVAGVIAAGLWVKHTERADNAKTRQEGQRRTTRLIVPDDDD